MRILFQGDSITDCNRIRQYTEHLGEGYARFIKAELGFLYPEKNIFFNRGISGDRIVDVYSRIKNDIINLKPDLMSILIGVNDVWHEFSESPNGVSAEKYFKIYSMLIEEILAELPDLKIIIMEPFALKGSGNEEYWDEFKAEVEKRAVMAKKVAENFGLPFVALQDKFDEVSKNTENSYWLADGVHPTECGHELIKREWIKAYNSILQL